MYLQLATSRMFRHLSMKGQHGQNETLLLSTIHVDRSKSLKITQETELWVFFGFEQGETQEGDRDFLVRSWAGIACCTTVGKISEHTRSRSTCWIRQSRNQRKKVRLQNLNRFHPTWITALEENRRANLANLRTLMDVVIQSRTSMDPFRHGLKCFTDNTWSVANNRCLYDRTGRGNQSCMERNFQRDR